MCEPAHQSARQSATLQDAAHQRHSGNGRYSARDEGWYTNALQKLDQLDEIRKSIGQEQQQSHNPPRTHQFIRSHSRPSANVVQFVDGENSEKLQAGPEKTMQLTGYRRDAAKLLMKHNHGHQNNNTTSTHAYLRKSSVSQTPTRTCATGLGKSRPGGQTTALRSLTPNSHCFLHKAIPGGDSEPPKKEASHNSILGLEKKYPMDAEKTKEIFNSASKKSMQANAVAVSPFKTQNNGASFFQSKFKKQREGGGEKNIFHQKAVASSPWKHPMPQEVILVQQRQLGNGVPTTGSEKSSADQQQKKESESRDSFPSHQSEDGDDDQLSNRPSSERMSGEEAVEPSKEEVEEKGSKKKQLDEELFHLNVTDEALEEVEEGSEKQRNTSITAATTQQPHDQTRYLHQLVHSKKGLTALTCNQLDDFSDALGLPKLRLKAHKIQSLKDYVAQKDNASSQEGTPSTSTFESFQEGGEEKRDDQKQIAKEEEGTKSKPQAKIMAGRGNKNGTSEGEEVDGVDNASIALSATDVACLTIPNDHPVKVAYDHSKLHTLKAKQLEEFLEEYGKAFQVIPRLKADKVLVIMKFFESALH